jgi:hypothetical protein
LAKSVEELDAFKLAHDLVLRVYSITKGFPKEEAYGLTSQLRRASASVPANLAEGANRNTRVDYRRFAALPEARPPKPNTTFYSQKTWGILKTRITKHSSRTMYGFSECSINS